MPELGDFAATMIEVTTLRNCPDCGVNPGEIHMDQCVVKFKKEHKYAEMSFM